MSLALLAPPLGSPGPAADAPPSAAANATPSLAAAGTGSRGPARAADPPRTLGRLSDAALLARQRDLVTARRELDVELAAVAAEIARRSDRSLGYQGLAARHGLRSPEQLVAQQSGILIGEARSLVRIGGLAADSAIRAAVQAGTVSVASADAVVRGLGDANDLVSRETLESTALHLLADADRSTVEDLAHDARAHRAALDAESVVDRERELRRRRSLTLHRLPDGMTRLVALLDPESAALVTAAVDAITAPRRGGPRFVDRDARERADALAADPRTTEQLALDGIVELIRIAATIDHGAETTTRTVLGAILPAVRIHVSDADLARRAAARAAGRSTTEASAIGTAIIEGQSEPVSATTAERHVCSAGSVPIHFDSDGQVVNVGRDHRLYTSRQRIGLAARDGGCRWPGCDRPPSWCEAHHIDEWDAHGGRTNIATGILLCRFHHLLVHDQGWRIHHDHGRYRATRTSDGEQLVLPNGSRIAISARAGLDPAMERPRDQGSHTGKG